MQRLHELVENNDIDLLKKEVAIYNESLDVLSGKKDLSLLHLCAIKVSSECLTLLFLNYLSILRIVLNVLKSY